MGNSHNFVTSHIQISHLRPHCCAKRSRNLQCVVSAFVAINTFIATVFGHAAISLITDPRLGYEPISNGISAKNFEEAVKNLERAVELKPQDPVINDHLGDAYWRVGRKLEARFQWLHARANKPELDVLKKIEQKMKSGLEAETPAPAEVKQEQKDDKT